MGWFGGERKDEEPVEALYGGGGLDDHSYDHAASPLAHNGGAGGGLAEFQQFSMGLQQQLMVQQVLTDLCDRAFTKCITSSVRDSGLTGKEVACIQSATNKWLDTDGSFAEERTASNAAATRILVSFRVQNLRV